MIDHVDELAELYALGSLEEPERERVERHAESCESCAIRLEEASLAVAAIEEQRPPVLPPTALRRRLSESIGALPERRAPLHLHWQVLAAAAAAFAVAFVPAWVAIDRNTTSRADDERAIAQMAGAPFSHATFMSPEHRPMDAKVIYGPHGDWYYVVVMHPQPNTQVEYVHGNQHEMLGAVRMHGDSGSLYLPIKHKMEELALVDDGSVVGVARLVY